MDNVGQIFDTQYEEVVLGDGLRYTEDIGLLKGVAPNKVASHLSGNSNNGGRVHERCCQAGHKIGGTGATGSDTDTNLTRSTCVTIGSVGGGLLMSHQDVM